jgi:6-phosphogluconolactonase (cycloisomerase 2 family)
MTLLHRFTFLALLGLLIFSGCDTLDHDDVIDAATDGAALAPQVDHSLLDDETVALLTHGEITDAQLEQRGLQRRGAVFTMSDDPSGNAILAFDRDRDGRLSAAGTYPTDGLGSGDGLNGTSNPMAFAGGNRYLYAVNGGSDEVSAFRVSRSRLRLLGTVSSAGPRPISVTVYDDLVYVINAGRDGQPGNIAGFRITRRGTLEAIAGSVQPINPGAGSPSQIDFTPDGSRLVITDKPTNTITTYPVDAEGVAGPPTVTAANGQTTFGFDFDRLGRLIVSEAAGGAPGASTVSSYLLDGSGVPQSITESLPTEQTAACWIETFGPFAYATNTGDSSVTGFFIRPDGELVRLHDDGVTVTTGEGSNPLDMDIALNYLYIQSQGTNRLSVYTIEFDGSLVSVPGGAVDGLPPTAVGVAAF